MCRLTILSFFIIFILHLTTAATTTKRQFKDSKISHIISAPDENENVKHLEKSLNFPSDKINTNMDKKKTVDTNIEMFDKLGLSKLRISPSHHRKRLAVESRHHSRPDDSHMFVIKLPPNPYYYTGSKNNNGNNGITDDNSKKVGIGSFKSNGKYNRIYHWNIPVLKKAFGQNQSRNPNFRHIPESDSEFFDIKNIPTWNKPWENESLKPFSKNGDKQEKVLKKKSPIYYAPKALKNNNIHKYFPGNGKPQSFYVIEKSHKPAYYQKLIP